jgi:hypothetical protein
MYSAQVDALAGLETERLSIHDLYSFCQLFLYKITGANIDQSLIFFLKIMYGIVILIA